MFEKPIKFFKSITGRSQKSPLSFLEQMAPGLYKKVIKGDLYSYLEANVQYVYDCVQVRADATSTVIPKLYKKTGKELILIEEHPFYDLIENPQRPIIHTQQLFHVTHQHLDLTGNGLWYHPLNAFGRPVELHLLYPQRAMPILQNDGSIVWRYNRGRGQIIEIPENEVLHLMYPNPMDPYMGLSPIESQRMGINLDFHRSLLELALLGNKARPEGILTSTQELDDTQADSLQKRWEKKYGGIERTGKIAVLGSGFTYQTIGMPLKDMEHLEEKKWTKKDIMSCYRVPAYKLGDMESAYKANAMEMEHSFQSDTIMPLIRIRDWYLTSIAKLFDKRLIVRSDSTVPRDREELRKQEKHELETYQVTINMLKQKKGEEEVPWGDRPYASAMVAPLITDEESEDEEPEKSMESDKSKKKVVNNVK